NVLSLLSALRLRLGHDRSIPEVLELAEVGSTVPVRVLGLSFSGHGSAICLVEDGQVVSAINLERLSRVKFALATVPPYALPLAVVLQHTFGFDNVRPCAD